MHCNFLKYVWKGMSEYSYGYILVTNQYSIEDIINCGKEIVIWGWRPELVPRINVLTECGIKANYVCDVWQPINSKNNVYGPPIRDYRELLKEKDKYYFIIILNNDEDITATMKMIQYAGYDEFGIVYEHFTKDFYGKKNLQKAFFDSINEIFAPYDFLHDKSEIGNLRHVTLTGAGYWDVPYRWLWDIYHRRFAINETGKCISSCFNGGVKPKYLEIGPGIGLMSFSVKKVLDLDMTWIVIPGIKEDMWREYGSQTTYELMKKYNISTIEGYIETDEFPSVKGYDVIVFTQVMEHLIYNPVNTFVKLAGMLADNGYIFVSVPYDRMHYNVQHFHEMPYPDEVPEAEKERRTLINEYWHFREYSYDEAMEVFHESGLECAAYRWTPPIHHFMLRKKKRKIQSV